MSSEPQATTFPSQSQSQTLEGLIFNSIPNLGANKIFVNSQAQPISFPTKVSNPFNFSLQIENQPKFIHSSNSPSTKILYNVNDKIKNLPQYIEQDCTTFKKTYEIFQNFSYNFEYQRRFTPVRSVHSYKDRNSAEKYKVFLKHAAEKVYKDIYRKKDIFNVSSNVEAIEKYKGSDDDLLSFDLLNDSTLTTVLSLHELFDRITDDEVSNCFCLTSNPFIHPINYLLSPAALALSYFHHSLLASKNPRRNTENHYNKQTLPRVTYLSLTGIYSEIDIDIINTFSDSVQTIVIYDENTGGPPILPRKNNRKFEEGSLREQETHFHNICKMLLLIPLECSTDEKIKSYSSKDMLNLIMDMVIPSIAKFKPTYIVLNCSLIFDQNNKTPFDIDESTLAKITQLLKVVADQKVIIYPFKLPTQTENHTLTVFNQVHESKKKQEQQQRLDYIFKRYAIPYNETYLLNSFVNTLEALSDLKTYDTSEVKKRSITNHLNNECRYMIGKYYKTHNYYHFLHSKSHGCLARVAEHFIKNHSQTTLNYKARILDQISFLNKQGDVTTTKLSINGQVKGELTLDYRSQYLVDYKDGVSEPTIYIFNAKINEQYLTSLKVPGPLSHLAIKLERYFFDVSEIEIISRFPLKNSCESLPYLFNSGTCYFETYVFQVYGTRFDDDDDQEYEDSNEITYFNFEENKSYKLTVDKKHEILPRHSVTACAFKKNNSYFLYVFGGQVQAHTTWMNREIGCLDVIDIVELYMTDDPSTGQWQYTMLSKSSLTSSKTLSFIPFKYSYAYYEDNEEKIILMGGTTFQDSVYDWTFPVFEFDTKMNKFISFDTFLNDAKGNLNIKRVKNDGSKTAVPEAIASPNKNFYFEKANRTFHFVVPSREDDELVCHYKYNRSNSTCSFEHSTTQSEDPKKFKNTFNIKEVEKQEGQALSLNFQKEITYCFTTLPLRTALIELIDYLFSIDVTTLIDKTLIYNYLDVMIKKGLDNDGVFNENETFEPVLIESKRTSAFKAVKRFLQRDENIEVFLKQDKQLKEVRSYLADREQNSTRQTAPVMERSFEDINDASASCEISFHLHSDQEQDNDQIGISRDSDDYKETESNQPNNMIDFSEKRQDKNQKDITFFKRTEENKVEENILDNGFLELELTLEDTGHIQEFKKSLTTSFNYHAFLNIPRNEVKVLLPPNQSGDETISLRFKIVIEQKLVDLSFFLSPSSIVIYQGVVVCYIDQEFKATHPQVYKAYKNCILFANVEEALTSPDRKSSYLVFKKLLPLCQEDCIFGRCLAVNNENLYLFGGKSIKYKGKTSMTYHKTLSIYSITKMKETLSSSIELRDNEVDEMEYNSGECVMVYNSKQIFICKRKEPSILEVFNNNGTIQTNVDLDISLKECCVHLNLVNFRGKEEILLTLYNINENMRFLLYDIENQTTEGSVTLIPTEGEENMLSPLLYSGFEEIQHNSSAQPLKEILVYNYRESEPKIVKYMINVTK